MSKRNTNTELRDRFLERIKKPGCPSVRTIAEEMQTLAKVFSRDGFTQGYLDDNIGPSMFGVRSETPDKEKSLTGEAIWIIVLDTFVAIMSGFIIFPACSSFGVSPDSGPNLIFVTLPNIFNAMPGGGRCVRGASAPRGYDAL